MRSPEALRDRAAQRRDENGSMCELFRSRARFSIVARFVPLQSGLAIHFCAPRAHLHLDDASNCSLARQIEAGACSATAMSKFGRISRRGAD
jgi:hypothetical protein